MDHIVINPTWRCQLRCGYCWLESVHLNRKVEHSWLDWAEALVFYVPEQSVVDVAGGEPLLFRGLVPMLQAIAARNLRWAITTNAVSTPAVEELVKARPANNVVINVSDHQGNAEADANIERLQSAFSVVVNRVDHPDAGRRDIEIASVLPYQAWKEGCATDGVPRTCTAGTSHWVADPAGDVWRCSVDMQVNNRPIGNLFDRTFTAGGRCIRCDFGCSSCYTTDPGAWLLDMHAI